MFTAADISLIRRKCLSDMESLLNLMKIPVPNWSSDDEFKLYDKLDDDITKKLCQLMKSPSIVDGYSNLLSLGNVKYDFGETNKEMLGKIVSNRDKIIQGAEQASKVPVVETSTPPPSTSPQQPATRTVVKEEVETLVGPVILGVVLIVAAIICIAFLDSSIIGVILIILGIGSAAFGLKGQKTRVTVTVPNNPASNQKTVPTPKNTSIQQPKITFTRREITEIMDILTQINKIFRSI